MPLAGDASYRSAQTWAAHGTRASRRSWRCSPTVNGPTRTTSSRGERGVTQWTFVATMPDGSRADVDGCDLFTFRNGKIAVKNSFRKNRVK